MASKKNTGAEATIVMTITLTSVVKVDDAAKLEKAADAEVARINKAINKLNLDDIAITQSKTFLKDE